MRAEIGMAMICGEIGVACDFSNTTAYLASWIERLRSDRKEIFRAAADAQRIADYMLAFHPNYAAASAAAPAMDSTSASDNGTDAPLAEAA